MVYLIISYLIIIPLAFKINADLRIVQEHAYQMMSMLVIFGSMFFENRKVNRDKFLIGVGAFGIITLWMYLAKPIGQPVLFNTLLGIGTFFAVLRAVEKKHIRLIFKVITGIAVFAVIYRAGQHYGYDIRNQITCNAPDIVPDCSFFGLKAAYGMYLACAVPLLLALLPDWSYIIVKTLLYEVINRIFTVSVATLMTLTFIAVIGLILAPVALSYSTGACMGVAVATLFFYWFRRRILFWILIIPIISASLFFLVKMDNPMGMQMSRLNMWGKVIQDSWSTPLGHGLDSFRNPEAKIEPYQELTRYFKHSFNDRTVRVIKTFTTTNIDVHDWDVKPTENVSEDEAREVYRRKQNGEPQLDHWDSPHNLYIQTLHELGFPGLIALIFVITTFWRRFWSSTKNIQTIALTASIIAFGIFALTQFPMRLSRIGHLLPILAGLWYVTTEKNGDHKIS